MKYIDHKTKRKALEEKKKRIEADIFKLREQTLKMKSAISPEYSFTELKIQ